MTLSEFWDALEHVYGSVLGRSLVSDLYIPDLQATPEQALKAGKKPDEVWDALILETDQSEEARWVHRKPKKRR